MITSKSWKKRKLSKTLTNLMIINNNARMFCNLTIPPYSNCIIMLCRCMILQIQFIFFQSHNQITIYMEFYDADLKKEIIQRSLQNEFFNQNEIFYVMDQITSVCHYLQINSIYHGDLRCQNILLNPSGIVKIGDYGVIHPFKTGLKTYQQTSYSSPEQLHALQKKILNPQINQYKSDVFTLGMSFLEMITLTSMHSCYSKISLSLNWTLVNEFISTIKTRLSQKFENIIRAMLQMNPDQRPEFFQINKLLNQPEQLIIRPMISTPSKTIISFSPSKPIQDSKSLLMSPKIQIKRQTRPIICVPQSHGIYYSFGKKKDQRQLTPTPAPKMLNQPCSTPKLIQGRSVSIQNLNGAFQVELAKVDQKQELNVKVPKQSEKENQAQEQLDNLEQRIAMALQQTQATIKRNMNFPQLRN